MGAHFLRAVLVACACIAATHGLDLSEILQGVPEEQRLDFIKYHVTRGYGLKNAYDPNFQIGYSDEFSVQLYEYFSSNRRIIDEDVVVAVQDKICFPSGECIDLDDPGIHPALVESLS